VISYAFFRIYYCNLDLVLVEKSRLINCIKTSKYIFDFSISI